MLALVRLTVRYQRGDQYERYKMEYPFLTHNELVLVDYLPGSSGQLLIRLWAELDAKIDYENQKIISDTSITAHCSTREIDYDILLPKRLTNWFLDKSSPTSIQDYAVYFDFLGTTLMALSQKWKRGKNDPKFYSSSSYQMINHRRIYGIHTWEKTLPFSDMIDHGFNITHIGIIPKTDRGLRYQTLRCHLCYPNDGIDWDLTAQVFNSKFFVNTFDLCTLLVDKDSDSIIDWLEKMIGDDFQHEKIDRALEILETYYREIVLPLE